VTGTAEEKQQTITSVAPLYPLCTKDYGMNGRWCQNVIYRSEWEMHSLRLPFLESRQVLSDSNSLLENVLSKSSFLMLLTMKWLVYLMCGSYWSAAEWPCYWLCSFYIAPLKICHCQTFKINNCGEHGNSFVNISKLLWTVNCCKAHSSRLYILHYCSELESEWVSVCVCVCVCIYIYIYIYTHTYTHTYIHTYIHTHIIFGLNVKVITGACPVQYCDVIWEPNIYEYFALSRDFVLPVDSTGCVKSHYT
jgi:hypothetical protein